MRNVSSKATLGHSLATGDSLVPLISKARKSDNSASVRLGNCIKGQTFPFFFQTVFSGDLSDVSQAASKSEGTKSVENGLL